MTVQKTQVASKENKDQSTVSKKELDAILARYIPGFAGDDEKEKERKRERARRAIEEFIKAINDLNQPLIDKFNKNNTELKKLHKLQKTDPSNPKYLLEEAKLLTENAHLLGSLMWGKNFLAERGVLFKGIEDKLPPNMDQQHKKINARLNELGQKSVPLPLSTMDQFFHDMKTTASFLIQKVMPSEPSKKASSAPPRWVKDSLSSPEVTVTPTKP